MSFHLLRHLEIGLAKPITVHHANNPLFLPLLLEIAPLDFVALLNIDPRYVLLLQLDLVELLALAPLFILLLPLLQFLSQLQLLVL